MKTNVRVKISTENVAGVQSPSFNVSGIGEGDDDMLAMIGITGGGQAITRAREKFSRYLQLLIDIASLQTQFHTIERVIKVTNRRVNALEFVVIPKIETTIKWIDSELDELDREDFYRLKCVQDKKKEAKEIEEAELAAKMEKIAREAGQSAFDMDKKVEDEGIFAMV